MISPAPETGGDSSRIWLHGGTSTISRISQFQPGTRVLGLGPRLLVPSLASTSLQCLPSQHRLSCAAQLCCTSHSSLVLHYLMPCTSTSCFLSYAHCSQLSSKLCQLNYALHLSQWKLLVHNENNYPPPIYQYKIPTVGVAIINYLMWQQNQAVRFAQNRLKSQFLGCTDWFEK